MARFTTSRYGVPVRPGDLDWNRPLPADRRGGGGTVTIGEALSAVEAFLSADDLGPVRAALAAELGHPVTAAAVADVALSLEKHGAFYHPVRVTVHTDAGERVDSCANLAVSDAGRAAADREVALLRRLSAGENRRMIPEVHAAGTGNGMPVFLTHWFSGFSELHWSGPEADRRLLIWSPAGRVALPPDAVPAVYASEAFILATLYDPFTFEAVGPWHHEAGDFVIRYEGGKPSLRLITVRGYRPLSAGEPADPAAILQALLIFLVQTALQTRIDRLDGVGDLVWGPDTAVGATLAGVFAGLAQRDTLFELPRAFRSVLAGCDPADLAEVGEAVTEAHYAAGCPEAALIRAHAEAHAAALVREIRAFPGGA